MKQKRQQGFTLIELMIVVAIVAILAAVALPFYADFTFRAKVSEVAAAIDACKVSVQDYREAEDDYPTSAAQAGCDNISSQYVSSITIAATNGTTPTQDQVTITGTSTGEVAGCQLLLATTDNGATWTGSSVTADPCTQGRIPPLFRN